MRYAPDQPVELGASLSAIEAAAGTPTQSPFDVWLNGTFGALAEGSTTGSFANAFGGAQYMFSPQLTGGASLSFSKLDTKDGAASLSSTSWSVGPYVVGQITDTLTYKVLATIGRSNNAISPTGAYTDQVGGNQLAFAASLAGNWSVENWTFAPVTSIAFSQQTLDAYTDSLGTPFAAYTAGSGQLALAPAVSYMFRLEDGTVVTTGGSFQLAANASSSGGTWTLGGLSDSLGANVSFLLRGGARFTGSATLGGLLLGDLKTIRGSIGLSAPLP